MKCVVDYIQLRILHKIDCAIDFCITAMNSIDFPGENRISRCAFNFHDLPLLKVNLESTQRIMNFTNKQLHFRNFFRHLRKHKQVIYERKKPICIIIDKINVYVRMLTCSVSRRTTTWPVLHLTSIRFNKLEQGVSI